MTLSRLPSPLRRALGAVAVVAALATTSLAQKVCMTAVLDGAQETPPVATNAKGTGVVIVDRSANTLSYFMCMNGLSSAQTAAHIHGFSGPGVPAGVKFNLPLGNFISGVLAYAEADEANILAGLMYFNIHTVNFPGGEMRGQIVRSASPITMYCVADGAQETPPNASAGKGVGWFKFDTVANSIGYSFTYTGLSAAETAAHVHGFSAPGVASGVKLALPLGFHKNGNLTYPQVDEANYLNQLAYVNIHTSTLPGGEIRGQIISGCSNPTSYCTSKVNSQGCQALAGWTGLPTLTGADDFHVTCTQVINNKSGIMYWGFNPKSAPFVGGTQCVQSPVIRTSVQNSGGNAPPDDCSGNFDFHFSDAYMAANGLVAGSTVFCEYWYRDPADAFTVSLSNAVAAEVLP